jgi:hypothetical protein
MKQAVIGVGFFVLIIGVILVVLPYVYVPRIVTEQYQNPKSSMIVSESFVLPETTTTYTTHLNANDSLNIQVAVTSGGDKAINFSVNDGTITYLNRSNAITINEDWIVPSSSNYTFVFDNSYGYSSKEVTVTVTKHWTETTYRDALTKIQLFPFESAYVGVALIAVGSGLATCGFIRKEPSKRPILK